MLSRHILLAAAFSAALGAGAQAQTCEDNFHQEGVPLLTGIIYRTHQIFPRVPPKVAVERMARAVQAEGFVGMRVDQRYGSITAFQETSGSGREQRLRVVTRPAGKGTRVDINFEIQQGQIAGEGSVRNGMCRLMDGMSG
ncbi:MAG: hypothetical protein LCH38_11195 [Proteobacteria bacterium]|nr:hypothetical protein [Pseudomonadota bacterium]